MVNEEILAGLKNALSRGYSLEKAMLSFINAGYNANEVREAATIISQPTFQQQISKQTQQAESQELQFQKLQPEKQQKSYKDLIYALIIAIAAITISIILIFSFL
ncbi:MAG: hypothetical protein N3D20_01830 [Candidatus Pacearchaeota archaeon]|nr:hypothetical protein [Candidatus Pacearchaeota archaeon]